MTPDDAEHTNGEAPLSEHDLERMLNIGGSRHLDESEDATIAPVLVPAIEAPVLEPRVTRSSWRHGLEDWVLASASFVVVLWLLRLYELTLSHRGASAGAVLYGVLADVFTGGWVALVCALPVLLVARVHRRAARVLHTALLVVIGLAAAGLVEYYATTGVALGADLFGYSWRDIRETTAASRSTGLASLIPFVVVAALVCWLAIRARRIALTQRQTMLATASIAVGALLTPIASPHPGRFAVEADYLRATNKLSYFTGRSLALLTTRGAGQDASLSGFPLLHDDPGLDVLGPMFTFGAERPNLVFVLVEGLGAEFVGPGARHGGFTPYLDSLTNRSVYFENFMSTAGRTFGALPAIFGSLPPAQSGFMELGQNMPPHISLFTLLQGQGYRTSFFTGTASHFDNIDVFLERQRITRLVDASKFGAGYEKEPGDNKGFSWGYGDRELFRKSLDVLSTVDRATPRLDVYLTITSHEPFIPPNAGVYASRFADRLATIAPAQRAEYERDRAVYSTLLYVDDALRYFMEAYSRRPDFARTIFFITGDHRLIPVPEHDRGSRFHVPMIVYSPMLKAPRRIASVSSHFDITPSVLAMLGRNFAMPLPKQVSWIGTGIDTVRTFRSVHSIPLMRVKNQLDEYLDGDMFISGAEQYQLRPGFTLVRENDSPAAQAARRKLAAFRAVNSFVTSGDHLYPGGTRVAIDTARQAREDSAFSALGFASITPTDAVIRARDLASQGDYAGARLALRRLLRDAPNFHDARTLLARTYAWEGQRDTANAILHDVVQRAPEYFPAYAALGDVQLYAARPESALALANAALRRFPRNGDISIVKARALDRLGRSQEALAALEAVPTSDPALVEAAPLRARLQRAP